MLVAFAPLRRRLIHSEVSGRKHHVAKSFSKTRTLVPAPPALGRSTGAWRAFWRRDAEGTLDAHDGFFTDAMAAIDPGASPWVKVLRSDRGDPLGVVVGRRSRRKPVVRIGYRRMPTPRLRSIEVVHGGIMISDSEAARSLAVGAIAGAIDTREAELVTIGHLPGTHPATDDLLGALRNAGRVLVQRRVHWWRRLIHPNTGEPVDPHSVKTRSNFRRKDRRLVDAFGGEVELCRFRSIKDTAAFIALAKRVTARSYQAALECGVTESPRWSGVIEALAKHGMFRGFVLTVGREPIAYLLGGVCSGKCTLIATSFDERYAALSPGLVLINRVLDDVRKQGVGLFDFGFGDAGYKRLHATEQTEDLTILCYARRPRATLAWLIDVTCTRTADRLRGCLDRVGWLVRIRKWVRSSRATGDDEASRGSCDSHHR